MSYELNYSKIFIYYSETCIKQTPSGNAVVSAQYRVSA